MEDNPHLLFVYGTLLNRKNEFADFLQQNCAFYSDAKIPGRLYDIGEYPGAVLDAEGDEFIYGKIFRMIDVAATLKVLDNYEGFGDDQPQPNEFIRTMADFETDIEKLNCWFYLYNLPADGLKRIELGKYHC